MKVYVIEHKTEKKWLIKHERYPWRNRSTWCSENFMEAYIGNRRGAQQTLVNRKTCRDPRILDRYDDFHVVGYELKNGTPV
jgi:hypothetical protein